MITRPRLACCNFFSDGKLLREFALDHGFDAVDWSLTAETLPQDRNEEKALVKAIAELHPLEVRYHGSFEGIDLGDDEEEEAERAMGVFLRAARLVSRLGGRYLTIHIGLGRDSTKGLSWEKTLTRLEALTRFAAGKRIRLCLENLAWGWTSRPDLLEKLLRKSGAWGTLDVGHAYVSPSVQSHEYRVKDFVAPHPERFLNAHVYHREDPEAGHVAPQELIEIEDRLRLLQRLPLCDWWVLELRQEEPLLSTLAVVREFLGSEETIGALSA